MRSGVAMHLTVRQLDQQARAAVAVHAHLPFQFCDARGYSPWPRRRVRQAYSVVFDSDRNLVVGLVHVDPHEVGQAMAPGVAQPLEHYLEYMLAEQTAPTEIGANFKAGIGARGELRAAALLDPRQ